jgi:hypothetical protein
MPGLAIRETARPLADLGRAAAPGPTARARDQRPTAQRDHRHGGQAPALTPDRAMREAMRLLVAREMRAAAPAPIVREHDRPLNARQQDHIPAVQRQEREAADRQRAHPPGRGPQQAPGQTQDPVTREAVRLLAEGEMMAAARARRASAPVQTVPTAREHDLPPIAQQQEPIPAVQRQEQEAAGRQQVRLHGRPAPGPTPEDGRARVGPAAGYRVPVRTGAPTPAAVKGRHAGQKAADVVLGEGNVVPWSTGYYDIW